VAVQPVGGAFHLAPCHVRVPPDVDCRATRFERYASSAFADFLSPFVRLARAIGSPAPAYAVTHGDAVFVEQLCNPLNRAWIEPMPFAKDNPRRLLLLWIAGRVPGAPLPVHLEWGVDGECTMFVCRSSQLTLEPPPVAADLRAAAEWAHGILRQSA
jgi:hypothetical protein